MARHHEEHEHEDEDRMGRNLSEEPSTEEAAETPEEQLAEYVDLEPTPDDVSPLVDEAEVETEGDSDDASQDATRPSDQDAASDGTEPTAEPEAPRVTTRTRRRAASRPAGPPAAANESGTPVSTVSTLDRPAEALAEPHVDGSASLHVPVKKKGARKR
jgi:ribonuclease E